MGAKIEDGGKERKEERVRGKEGRRVKKEGFVWIYDDRMINVMFFLIFCRKD